MYHPDRVSSMGSTRDQAGLALRVAGRSPPRRLVRNQPSAGRRRASLRVFACRGRQHPLLLQDTSIRPAIRVFGEARPQAAGHDLPQRYGAARRPLPA